LNPFDEREVHDLIFQASVAAVADGFPHLSVREIIEPPHDMFDAALARQIVIHLMVSQFGLPKRRVVEMQERSREAINRALATVDARLGEPRFAAHYRCMASRAVDLAETLKAEAA
jgi:hypothetical protein